MSRFSRFLKIFTVLFTVLALGTVGAVGLFATQQVTFGKPDVMEQVVPVGSAQSDLLTTLKFDSDETVEPTKVLHGCGAWRCGRAFLGFRECCRTCYRDTTVHRGRLDMDKPNVETVKICRTFWFF